MGTIKSGEFNPVFLGREYLNRTNRPVDCFGTEQLELGSLNWNVYYPYRGSFNGKIRQPKRKKMVYLFYLVKPMIRYCNR